jgi:hypothetical protein
MLRIVKFLVILTPYAICIPDSKNRIRKISVCLSVTLNRPLVVLFSRENGSTDFGDIFCGKKSTRGDIGYLKLSHSILNQNGGNSKLCLLRCTDTRVRERVARPCGCVCLCVCDGIIMYFRGR